MDRRDLFKLMFMASVPLGALLEPDRAPRDTDDPKYDEILDEMLGEEWS